MTAFTEKLDRAAGQALCAGLTVAGGRLIGAGAVSLVAGGAGIVPIAYGMAAFMAAAAVCDWDPEGGSGGAPIPPYLCYEGESLFSVYRLTNGEFVGGSTPLMQKITSVVFREYRTCQTGGGYELWDINGIGETGLEISTGMRLGGPCGSAVYTWTQEWEGDSTCKVPGPNPEPDTIPPYTYTDPEDGCTLIVNTKGWSTDETGTLAPVYKIEPGPELRADGGRIGACNFAPVIYTGGPMGPGEPPIIRPWDPGWDDPLGPLNPWADLLRETAAGVTANVISNYISELLKFPYPPATYELKSFCEVDSDCKPVDKYVTVDIPSIKGEEAILARIDALVPLLQAQKDFRQPICKPCPLEGELRTIGFISEEVSPNGKSCLRKRLRYRSVSGLGLDAVIDHWKDFQFDAGPVTVKHRGARWGTITVWAASADEGKRVIRHAAGEAGIDADQTGRWEVSGSSSSRLGMPGTMKVNQAGGYYWITARDGSDNRPLVGKT